MTSNDKNLRLAYVLPWTQHSKNNFTSNSKIQELEDKLIQQIANSATSVSGSASILGQIPASIDTSGSLITREEMQAMFVQFQKSLPTTTGTESKKKDRTKRGNYSVFIPNDLGNGERSKRRYSDSTEYCPSHGYDIKPGHTPVSCTNRKDCHNELATIDSKMGGVTTNCFHHKQ